MDIIVDNDCPEWKWGTEAFWMAFTAAYPSFPSGSWPFWNPIIALEGSYIQNRLSDGPTGGSNESDLISIWQQFELLVFPYL